MSGNKSTSTSPSLQISRAIDLPISLRVVPNRIVKAALTESLADPNTNLPNESHCTLYQSWARGGSGMILTGNVMVDRYDKESPRNVVLDMTNEGNLQSFRKWADSIKIQDAGQVSPENQLRPLAIMQLSHAGRQSPLSCTGLWGPAPVAPTGGVRGRIRLPGVIGQILGGLLMRTPRELSTREIRVNIVDQFVKSAQLAEQAGFDGVEIHGAHGYLLSQFLSAAGNFRDHDNYGGSAENRRRLFLEIIDAVRRATSPRFVVGVKINSKDSLKDGKQREDECLELIQVLRNLQQLDFIEISGGSMEDAMFVRNDNDNGNVNKNPNISKGYFSSFAKRLKEEMNKNKDKKISPLIVLTGGFRTAEAMESTIEEGLADMIGLGRPVILDPNFPNKLLKISTTSSTNNGETKAEISAPLVAQLPRFFFPFAQALLAAAMNSLWYQRQLERLSQGKQPNLGLSIFWTVTVTFIRAYVWDWEQSWRAETQFDTQAMAKESTTRSKIE